MKPKHKHYWLPEPSTRRENVEKWAAMLGFVAVMVLILVYVLNT